MALIGTESTKETAHQLSVVTWVRWAAGIGLLVAVNFLSVAYYAGNINKQVDVNTGRITRIELLIETSATKDQVIDLKSDVHDIQKDIKELIRSDRQK